MQPYNIPESLVTLKNFVVAGEGGFELSLNRPRLRSDFSSYALICFTKKIIIILLVTFSVVDGVSFIIDVIFGE